MIPGSLSAASFWVGLRQEIYIAVITQQPVKVNLDHYVVDRSFTPADDYAWSNRAIVHLADVLNFCFGSETPSSSQWVSLNEACKKWSRTRPTSFNPYFYRARTNHLAFPEVWHGSSCHGKYWRSSSSGAWKTTADLILLPSHWDTTSVTSTVVFSPV